MNNLNLKLELTAKSLTSFDEILSEPYSPIIRDATLIRFQRSVEIFWKLLKNYLCVYEGFVCESPKSCIKMAFKVEFMAVEFKAGKRMTQVTKNRTMKDFTQFVKILFTENYSEAEVIRLVTITSISIKKSHFTKHFPKRKQAYLGQDRGPLHAKTRKLTQCCGNRDQCIGH